MKSLFQTCLDCEFSNLSSLKDRLVFKTKQTPTTSAMFGKAKRALATVEHRNYFFYISGYDF